MREEVCAIQQIYNSTLLYILPGGEQFDRWTSLRIGRIIDVRMPDGHEKATESEKFKWVKLNT